MSRQDDLPPAIIEAAIRWSVTLASGTADAAHRRDYQCWLEADERHRRAAERLAAIDDEVRGARRAGHGATDTLDHLQRGRRRRRRRGLGGGLLVLVLVAVGLVGGDASRLTRDYVTGTGERQRLTLPGGTRVVLNADTALDILEKGGHPTLRLHAGEILVDSEAAAPADKPRVLTEDGRLDALGTRFQVSTDGPGTRLTVLQGRVAVHATGGERLGEARPGGGWRLVDGTLAPHASGLRAGGWVDGVVEARGASLGEVLEALAPYRAGWLGYAPEVADLKVTGVFQLSDTDAALDAIAQSLPVHLVHRTRWWVRVEEK
ncbi:Anti-sigma factor FoxR [Alcanivorax sp. 521-1]|uniref:Anti-sigma factor FoxR n=1 Tax=Alloalcanivorax profundimaris TaxID=2735259 RepID=A0ABS0AM78_9GAMM|nr:FecR domain-containing protein [Alloalcanivorax profundimaris]MBF5055125.1 Anti-sigma factor FoxR [Alloalcanivorax profundimaris]